MNEPLVATDSTFDLLLPPQGVAVVVFWSPGCTACTRFAPVFAACAGAHPHITHLTVNTATSPRLVEEYEIQAVPTTVFLMDGAVALELAGATTMADLAELLAHVAATDGIEQPR